MMKFSPFVSLTRFWQTFFKIAFISIVVGLLAGCPANVSKQLNFDESKSSQYYLSQYLAESGSKKIDWQLLAIRALLMEGNTQQAEQLVMQLPTSLSQSQQKESILLRGELAAQTGQNFELNQLSVDGLSDSDKIRYYKIKIALDKKKNDINGQIRDYVALEKYGTSDQRHSAINETWSFLTSLDESSINSILVYANESVLQGWVDLIYTYKNNVNNYPIGPDDDAATVASKEQLQYNSLKSAVSEWMMQYANHPAALYLPRNIYGDKYRLSDDSSKKNVALFLPLSGSSKVFSDTIRLGYFDASQFYSQEPQQNITIYDTSSSSIESLVKQAEQQGADLIVGPLLKQDVLEIMRLSPATPVLALNKVDNDDLVNHGTSKICFFALSPEDEASDAASHIYSQHKTKPLLIVPKNDLGQRVANKFAEYWRQNSSSESGVYVQYFDSEAELKNKINSGVGIELEGKLLSDSSPLLNQQNDSLLVMDPDTSNVALSNNTNPKFDAIYIYASHSELALLKAMIEMKSNKVQLDNLGAPLLDKKGVPIAVVKDVPTIYASSRSNIADTTQDYRYDMDQLQFSDIPFILNQSPLMEQLPSYIKDDYSLVRLYAMGFDAWLLANHYNQLKPHQINALNGMTGSLSVAKNCEITRSLSWQQYLNGQNVIVQ